MNLLRSGVAPGVQYEVERLLRSENAKDPFHQVHLITEALKQPDYDPKAVAEMFRALKKKASESYVWGASNCLHSCYPFMGQLEVECGTCHNNHS
jgi:hypothetical protein